MHQQEAFKHLSAAQLRGLTPIDESQDIYISQGSAGNTSSTGAGGIFPLSNHQKIPNSSSQTQNFNIPILQQQYQPTQLIQHLNFQQQQQQQQLQQQQQQLQQFQHLQLQQQPLHQKANSQPIIIHPPLSSIENTNNNQLLPFGSTLSLPPRKFHKLGESTLCRSNWVCWACQKTLCVDCTDHNPQHAISNLESIFDGIPESVSTMLADDYQQSISSLDIIEKSFSNCLKSIKDIVERAFVRQQLCKASATKDYLQMGKLLLSNYKLLVNSEESPPTKQQILQETTSTTKDALEQSMKAPIDKLSGFLSQMTSIMIDTITKSISSSDPFITSASSPFQQPNYFQQFNNSKNNLPQQSSNNTNNNFNPQLNFHPPHNLHPRVIQVNDIPTNYARMIGQQAANQIKPTIVSNSNPNISQKIPQKNSLDGSVDSTNSLPFHNRNSHNNNNNNTTINSKNPNDFVERQYGYIDKGPYKKIDIEGGNAITRPNSQQQQQQQLINQEAQKLFHKSSSSQSVQQQPQLQQLPSPHGILGFSGNLQGINNEIFDKLLLNNNPHHSSNLVTDKIDYSSGSTVPYSQLQSVETIQNNETMTVDSGNALKPKRHHNQKTRENAFYEFHEQKKSIKDIAKKYGVVESTVKAWISMIENNNNQKNIQNPKSSILAESDGYSSHNNNNNSENKPTKLNSCDLSDSSARKDQSSMKIEHNCEANMEEEAIGEQDKEQINRASSNDGGRINQEKKEELDDDDENNNNNFNRYIQTKQEAEQYNQCNSRSVDSAQQPNLTNINKQPINTNQQYIQATNNEDNNNQNKNLQQQQQQQQSHSNPAEFQPRPQSIQSDDEPIIEIKMKLICFPLLNNNSFPTIPVRSSMLGQSQNNKLLIKTQGSAENVYEIIATQEFDENTIIEELKFGRISHQNEIVIFVKLSNQSVWLWEWQQGLEAVQISMNVINFDVFEMNKVLLLAVQEKPFQINVFEVRDRSQAKNQYYEAKEENRQIIYDIDSEESSHNQELQHGCSNRKILENGSSSSLVISPGTSSKLLIEQIIGIDNIKPKELLVRDYLLGISNFVFWGCKFTNRLFLACSSGNYFWAYATEENKIEFSVVFETFSDDQQVIQTLRLYKKTNRTQEIVGASETGLLYFFDVLKKAQNFFKTKQKESKRMIDIQVFHPIEDTGREIIRDGRDYQGKEEDPKVIVCYDNYLRIRSHKKLMFPQPMRCASLEVKDNEITVYYMVINSANIFKHSLIANAG